MMRIPPFELERYFAEYEFHVPYLLSSSDCQSLSIQELLDLDPGAVDDFHRVWLGYTESQGSPALREEIAGLYEQVGPDQVLVHSGAEEAIFNFMHAVLTPADHVVAHWPCYQSLEAVARSIGCQVTRWVAREDNGWELDLDFLEDRLQPNTRAVVVNCPHNPTGYLMSHDKWRELLRLSKERGFLVFSDEVYRLLEYQPEDRLPALCDLDERGVSLGVVSKSFGLAGLRIGWIATRNRDVYQSMAAFKDYTTICNSAPSEFLATLALRHKDRVIARNRGIVLDNLQVLDAFFARHRDRFHWHRPQAGPIAFPSLLRERDAELFCQRLVREAGVLLLPGTVYDGAHSRNFRIGFGRENLPEAIRRLEAFLVQAG
jgi:aspartate/methionine/tyrosine aminotransferase